MSVQNDILEVLNQRDQPVKTSDLAEALKKPSSTIRGETTRLKQKGYIEGDSQEGWVIADTGKTQLERGDIHPSMLDEEVTPRQQFEAIGRRIGIKDDRIVLATDIVWSGDYDDIQWVWAALGQADIANDLRTVWVNAWRAKLHKGIPPELETELTGVGKTAVERGGAAPSKRGREYIIVDDEPVRVGENLGDYSLQDAKDILGIRVLRSRFSGASQAGTGQGGAAGAGATEKVSDLITALEPFINKDSDQSMLRELIGAQMALQRQEILSHIPQPGQPSQPKSLVTQITEAITTIGSLREIGPTLRSILGIPESPSGNPSTGTPVQLTGPNGKPLVMDLGQVIDWKKFQGEERRADERQTTLTGLAQTVRENIQDGIQAILKTAEEAKSGTGAGTKTSEKQEQLPVFECADCKTPFSAPLGWAGQPIKCPNPACGREYTKEELLA